MELRLPRPLCCNIANTDPSNSRLQLSRLLARPSNPPLTPAQASSRISSQLPLSDKLPYATSVLDNSGTHTDLAAQVDRLVAKWRTQQGGATTGWWWRLCWLIPPLGLAAGGLCLLGKWWRFKRDRSGNGRRRGRGEVAAGPSGRAGDGEGEGERIEMGDMKRRNGRGSTGSSAGSIYEEANTLR